ncbi:MAG: HAD hydrolase family protein [Helicobacteraceae bacterium]|nr:HAD hydrolase family protein [Helicobacteraceae bacterium]
MIDLIVLDVDGCLTDGKIIYSDSGDESKNFNVKDGLAISSWIRMGHQAVIITGRHSRLLERRAKELGITQLHQGVKDKAALLKKLSEELNTPLRNISAIGDDLNDYKMLSMVGLSFTPQNASSHFKRVVNRFCKADGGEGAVREMIEALFEINDEVGEFLALWQ